MSAKALYTKAAEKLLNEFSEAFVREVMDKAFSHSITVRSHYLAEGLKEGYYKTLENNPGLPELPDKIFLDSAEYAIAKAIETASKTKGIKFGTVTATSTPQYLTLLFPSMSASSYAMTRIKSWGIEALNSAIGSEYPQLVTSGKLKAGKKGVSDQTIRTSLHRSHIAHDTVGAVAMKLAIEAIEANIPALSDFSEVAITQGHGDLIESFDIEYQTEFGLKRGSRISTLAQSINTPLSIELHSAHRNIEIGQSTDLKYTKPVLEKFLAEHMEKLKLFPVELLESEVSEATINELLAKISTGSVTIKVLKNKLERNFNIKITGKKQGPTKGLIERRKSRAQMKRNLQDHTAEGNTTRHNLEAYLRSGLKEQLKIKMDNAKGADDLMRYRTGNFTDTVKVDNALIAKTNLVVAYTMEHKYSYLTPGHRAGPGHTRVDGHTIRHKRDPRHLVRTTLQEMVQKFGETYHGDPNIFGRVYYKATFEGKKEDSE